LPPSGEACTYLVQAENDDCGVFWTNIFSTQLPTGDPDTDFERLLPTLSGPVHIRVRDTDQTPGGQPGARLAGS
jgi:hypothetical protein